MTILLKLKKSILILGLLFTSFFTYSYPRYTANSYTTGTCPYYYSSTCQTNFGKRCSTFTIDQRALNHSTCFKAGSFFACFKLPPLLQPIVQNVCYLRGTACLCAFGFINGLYMYESGIIL